MKKSTLYLTQSAIIAALYVVLTWVSNIFGLASGAIQVRISEALCVLPLFTPAAIPGVGIGCLLANILTSGNPFDIVFGTLASLIGVTAAKLISKSKIVKKHKFLVSVPTIISNTLIIPFVVIFAFTNNELTALPLTMLLVFIGEFIACGVLGYALIRGLEPVKKHIFPKIILQ